MKKIKVKFSISTIYHGSEFTEIIEIDVKNNTSEDEINTIVEKEFKQWIYENTETDWEFVK